MLVSGRFLSLLIMKPTAEQCIFPMQPCVHRSPCVLFELLQGMHGYCSIALGVLIVLHPIFFGIQGLRLQQV